jgi:hypothetical protein
MLIATLLLATAPTQPRIGAVVHARGAGNLTCATAFLPKYRTATENWIAGFWAAWDMAQIKVADPVAANSDLNGIVAEVDKICRDQPSSGLILAVLSARRAVKARNAK